MEWGYVTPGRSLDCGEADAPQLLSLGAGEVQLQPQLKVFMVGPCYLRIFTLSGSSSDLSHGEDIVFQTDWLEIEYLFENARRGGVWSIWMHLLNKSLTFLWIDSQPQHRRSCAENSLLMCDFAFESLVQMRCCTVDLAALHWTHKASQQQAESTERRSFQVIDLLLWCRDSSYVRSRWSILLKSLSLISLLVLNKNRLPSRKATGLATRFDGDRLPQYHFPRRSPRLDNLR